MQKNVIVLKHKDQLVPELFVKKITEQKLSSYSILVPSAEGSFMLDRSQEQFSVQDFNDTQAHFQNSLMMFHFGVDYPEGFVEDDIQPFPLVEKDGSPVLVAFADGSFPGFYQEKSSHPNEFFLSNTFLMPQIKAIYDQYKGNLEMVMAKLREPLHNNIFGAAIVNKGLISIASANGDLITFQKGDKPIVEFPWGWTSDALGYEEKSYPEQKAEPEKPKGMLGRLTGGLPSYKASEPAKVEAPKSGAEIKQQREEKQNGATTVVQIKAGKRMVKCPNDVKGNKNIRDWYTINAGFLPKNWKARPEVETTLPIKDFKDLPVEKSEAKAETAVQAPAETKEKDVTPHHVQPEMAKPVEKKPTTLSIPPDEVKLIKEMMEKGVIVGAETKDGNKIVSPADVKNWEAPVPTFAEQVKMESMVPTLSWSTESLLQLAQNTPMGIVVLAANWRALYLAELQKRPQQQTTPHTKSSHTGLPVFNRKAG